MGKNFAEGSAPEFDMWSGSEIFVAIFAIMLGVCHGKGGKILTAPFKYKTSGVSS